MAVMRVVDWLLVNHLFRTNDRGETIFYPNGFAGRGYLVPPDREPGVRSGVRRLTLIALIGALTLAVLVPRLIEWWFDITIPPYWFVGGAMVTVVVLFSAIIRSLSRLTAGLEPASSARSLKKEKTAPQRKRSH